MNNVHTSPNNSPILVNHVPSVYQVYPGESLTFFTRVCVQQAISGLTVQIVIPEGMVLGDFSSDTGNGNVSVWTESEVGPNHLEWKVDHDVQAGTTWEYQTQATVAHKQDPTKPEKVAVESWAKAKVADVDDFSAQETASVVLSYKGHYLQYLPAIYQSDDLMGRFLMLYESFWGPTDKQIATLPMYFDAKIAPPDFLPWLASWFDLILDDSLSEKQQRDLILAAFSLYRKRGTRQGLKRYLEIYTGGQARIIEHRGNNFRLGIQARLGNGLALGTENQPHTFTVHLRLPKKYLEGKKRDIQYYKIENIVETEKPAHTSYTLHIEEINNP